MEFFLIHGYEDGLKSLIRIIRQSVGIWRSLWIPQCDVIESAGVFYNKELMRTSGTWNP